MGGIMLTPTFVKLVSWYDNEWGYSTRLVPRCQHGGRRRRPREGEDARLSESPAAATTPPSRHAFAPPAAVEPTRPKAAPAPPSCYHSPLPPPPCTLPTPPHNRAVHRSH